MNLQSIFIISFVFHISNLFGMLQLAPQIDLTDTEDIIGIADGHKFPKSCTPQRTIQAWKENRTRLQQLEKIDKPVLAKAQELLSAIKIAETPQFAAIVTHTIQECSQGLSYQQWPQLLGAAQLCAFPHEVQIALAFKYVKSVRPGERLAIHSPEISITLKKELHRLYFLYHKNGIHESDIKEYGYPEISVSDLLASDEETGKKHIRAPCHLKDLKKTLPPYLKIRQDTIDDNEFALDLTNKQLTALEGFEAIFAQPSWPYDKHALTVADLRNNHLPLISLDLLYQTLANLKLVLIDRSTEFMAKDLRIEKEYAPFDAIPFLLACHHARLVTPILFDRANRTARAITICQKQFYDPAQIPQFPFITIEPQSSLGFFSLLFTSNKNPQLSLAELKEEIMREHKGHSIISREIDTLSQLTRGHDSKDVMELYEQIPVNMPASESGGYKRSPSEEAICKLAHQFSRKWELIKERDQIFKRIQELDKQKANHLLNLEKNK